MPTQPISDDELQRRLEVIKSGGSILDIAQSLGLSESTVRRSLKIAEQRGMSNSPITYPDMPDDDLPIEEIIDIQCRRFEKRKARASAEKWMQLKVGYEGPIGIAFMGDPHVDSNGCNWPLLRKHVELLTETPAVYGVSIGDMTDNWVGRISGLYALNDTSRDTAIKLSEWLISESGITWLLLIRGNHDAWSGPSMGDDPITWISRQAGAPYMDWACQFIVELPNGRKVRVDARHDFKGHSMWNSAHGMQKAAHGHGADWAHIYVCGHRHNWALHHEESASREFTYWLSRVRGYKFIDPHQTHLGHDAQEYGATSLAIIDPEANDMRFVQMFADLEEGIEVLRFKQAIRR